MSTLIQELVSAEGERHPDAPAVVHDRTTLTYRQLDVRSNQLARLLRESGCQRGARVCVLSGSSPAAIVAMLAIYKADAIYVPLDPSSPVGRLARIVRASEPWCLLTGLSTASVVDDLVRVSPEFAKLPIASLENSPIAGKSFFTTFSAGDAKSAPTRALAYRNRASNPAHILFTSGPNVVPHGVVITHTNIARSVLRVNQLFGVTSNDRQASHAPLAADLAFFDILGSLAAGACVYPVPDEFRALPFRLATFIRDARLTQWSSVPAVLSTMAQFDAVRMRDFPELKRVIWSGDTLAPPALKYWMTRAGHVRFTSTYGLSEASGPISHYTVPSVDAAEQPLPIGRAGKDQPLLVLDENARAVTAGQTGELYVRGIGLSPGYWRDPQATRAAFVTPRGSANTTDRLFRTGDLASVDAAGWIHLAGRRDRQVKSRGHQVDLGDLEAALQTLTTVDDAVVVAVPTRGFEGTMLCCAYVPAAGAEVTPATLRRILSGLLPSYMLPARWRAVPSLPRDAAGRHDRAQIWKMFSDTVAVAP